MFSLPEDFGSDSPILRAVTDLGDTALLAVCVIVAVIILLRSGSRREALVLAGAFATTGFCIMLLKFAFLDCLLQVAGMHLQSPSGHASMSAGVIGAAAVLVARRQRSWVGKSLILLPALILVLTIGVSRVLLGCHTPDEVKVGLVVGSLVTVLASLCLRGAPMPKVSGRLLLPALVVTLLFMHGSQLPIEETIRQIAMMIRPMVGAPEECTRVDLPPDQR